MEVIGGCFVNAGARQVLSYASSPDAENRANARLIAAAPELLAALIDVYANVRSDSPEMWERVTAAIAKATGGQP